MWRRVSRVVVVVVALAVSGCSFKPLVLTPKAASPDGGGSPVVVHAVPTVLVLDGSGSMSTEDAPGPRIDAAKAAAHTLIGALPDDAQIGLQTYGTTTGSAPQDKAAGCRDVTILIPLGPLERPTFTTKIDTITPLGYTPISLALTTAAEQLPADATPQAIVVVSDGEDTCDTPPCDTAATLKKTHPGLAISTVGFKLDGPAADQLRCIANTTGGLFVQAANATQLTTRLLATQNIDQANQSLSATGMNGIDLGASIGDIRTKHPDFPDANTTGSVTVIWKDCDYTFTDATLTAIAPHHNARTIDGLTTGSPVTKATELYGPPLASAHNNDNTTTLTYDADPKTPNAYQMKITNYNTTGTNNTPTGTITTITLCHCKPQPRATGRSEPEQIILKPVDSQGDIMPGYTKDDEIRGVSLDCEYGQPSPYDVGFGVRRCDPNAAMADACWPTSGGDYMLCLQDPFKPELAWFPATGGSSRLTQPDGPARPLGIELEDGTQCRARLGGSWSTQEQHPDYAGYFYCSTNMSNPDALATWGSGDDGIRKGPDGWTVEVGGFTGGLTTHRVIKTYYVGTA